MAPIACFEDYETGMTFETASIVVTLEAIEEFAVAYDPQVYHRAATAPATQFGRIIASGWQTASIGMRLTVDAGIFPPAAPSASRWNTCAGSSPSTTATACTRSYGWRA